MELDNLISDSYRYIVTISSGYKHRGYVKVLGDVITVSKSRSFDRFESIYVDDILKIEYSAKVNGGAVWERTSLKEYTAS